jgi:3',5'-cyclic AMP phosphodiesterase CpdA
VRIAHISDLHVLALGDAVPFRLLNKRLTGYANLRWRRGHHHQTDVVSAILDKLSRSSFDHVVITGDVSNLALESEFEAVRRLLDDVLRLAPASVSIVPGNHDVYTRGAQRSQRFGRFFAPFLTSDLPDLAVDHSSGRFPIVKLRGSIAFIGLSTAVARLPFVASGHLGERQLSALREVLASPELRGRTPVLLQHHPAVDLESWTWRKRKTNGLTDAAALGDVLFDLPRALVLHGHLHRRIHRRLPTRDGDVHIIGAPSASLVHPAPDRMAGYNVYELGENGSLQSAIGYRFDPSSRGFLAVSLPEETIASRVA